MKRIKWNDIQKTHIFYIMFKILIRNQRAIKTKITNNKVILLRTSYLDSVFVQAQYEYEYIKELFAQPFEIIPFRNKLSYYELSEQLPNYILKNYLNFDSISFLYFYEQNMLTLDPTFKLRNFIKND